MWQAAPWCGCRIRSWRARSNAPSGEEPDPDIISLDLKPFTPSAICGFVAKFADPMPRYICDVLRELGYAEGDLCYAAGARFVIGLIENRQQP